jgi:predicted transcriptional regulator
MPRHPLADTLSRAASWSPEAQAELAAYAAEIEAALGVGEYPPTDAELAGIDRGLADARAGRFATEDEVAAVFARFRGA